MKKSGRSQPAFSQVSDLKGGVTTSIVNDVLNIMKSTEYCGLSESKYHLPSFISTGEDACNFLPMKNGILDVEAAIAAMKSGAPLPPLLPPSPDLFCINGFDYDYDPTATCPRFMQYLAVSIVGASGDDVIVGGIGNDRMHGGGGDDVFTFCDNWGVDNVEQLEGGSVTLWFASGDESKWNADTMTYTDGENSVKVTGVTSVNLKFGDDGFEQYAMLAQAGAFFDATSERIFEEEGKGILASL